jgi:hypothetical protein|tara:strand:- start:1215 stop:1484 length:270 start_codon:yes stop_codon:yes gene_type:complete
VTQNVGETSKVEFSLERKAKIPCFCPVKKPQKRNFSRRRVPFCDVAKQSLASSSKAHDEKNVFEEDVENLAKGVSHYFMMLLLPVVLQK